MCHVNFGVKSTKYEDFLQISAELFPSNHLSRRPYEQGPWLGTPQMLITPQDFHWASRGLLPDFENFLLRSGVSEIAKILSTPPRFQVELYIIELKHVLFVVA